MKRLTIVILCIGVIIAALSVSAAAFTDIYDDTTAEAVATLRSMGIVAGTSETEYSPSLILTRAQVCAMMIRTMGLEASAEGYVNKSLFRDVKNSMWHAGYVNLAYHEGIISGYGNGYFGPNDEITYGQFVTMLLRLLGYTENDIGKMWPADYVVFAADIGLNEDVNLGANDKVSRGDAAIILYNTLMTKAKGANAPYYHGINGYASSVAAIILDNKVESTTTGDLYALKIDASGVAMKYYYQENRIPDAFIGNFGSLLLNGDGEAIGFLSEGKEYADIVIGSAKQTGITDFEGKTYKINNEVIVISGEDSFVYGGTGYVKVDGHSGQPARFYYDDDGKVAYIYLAKATDPSDTKVAVASLFTPAPEFERVFGIASGTYHVTKNGEKTEAGLLTKYDVAYYDNMTDTLHASDYRVTGYIEDATPSLNVAKSITVSGCEIGVLECAWDTLANFKLGDRVTLLLTDKCEVAAVCMADLIQEDMYGILSLDGSFVTLCGSELVMRPKDISAKVTLNGSLVKVDTTSDDVVRCTAVSKSIIRADTVDIKAKTVGGIALAPDCSIFEWGGSGRVYSLAGEYGVCSSDFSDVYWTDTLSHDYVDYYHVNRMGLVDILVLRDVTGNFYEYGMITSYSGENGIPLSQGGAYTVKAVTLTNDDYPNGSKKYVCTVSGVGSYTGIALGEYSTNYTKVAAAAKLNVSKNTDASDFRLGEDDKWYAVINDYEIPVSENVKIHISSNDKWLGGYDGLVTALSSELSMRVYYDRTLTTGSQVRLIELYTEK